MRNWKLLLVIPFLFMGCVHDLIEPENPNQDRLLTKSSADSENERVLSLSSWTRTGTSYHTLQIRVSPALAGPLTVVFDLHPVTKDKQKLPSITINPCILPAGQNYKEVDIPTNAAGWREMGYDGKQDDWDYVTKTTTFTIQIKGINYAGDTNPLYVDQSVWQISKAYDAETYGWDINRLSGGGQKNYRPPYDVIGAVPTPNPNPGKGGGGGGGGGHGPIDPPSSPTE